MHCTIQLNVPNAGADKSGVDAGDSSEVSDALVDVIEVDAEFSTRVELLRAGGLGLRLRVDGRMMT